MPDYSKGKIYKIVVDTEEQYKPYVGSSCQELSQRMTDHRGNYTKWKNGKLANCSSFDLFDKFGVDKCKIILVEEYPCDSRMKLLMKEREWFDKMECCNKYRPYVSNEEYVKEKKEYRDEHKEQFAIYIKQYSETHKSKLDEYHKQYRENNRKLLIEKQKSYATKNKEQLSEKGKEKFECDCGSICRKSDKSRHERSLKHQDYLSSLKV